MASLINGSMASSINRENLSKNIDAKNRKKKQVSPPLAADSHDLRAEHGLL